MRVFVVGCTVLVALAAYGEELKGGNPFGTVVIPRGAPYSYSVIASTPDDSDNVSAFETGIETDQFTLDVNERVTASQPGASGQGDLEFRASTLLDLETSILTGSVFIDAASQAMKTEDVETAVGSAGAEFQFNVEFSVPVTVTVTGEITTGTDCQDAATDAFFQLFDRSTFEDPLTEVRIISTDGENGMRTVSVTEEFEAPGALEFVFSVDTDADLFGTDGENVAEGGLDISFTITPFEFEEVFWVGGDGEYGETFNWEPMAVPNRTHMAIFDQDASYVVSIDDEETGRAVVERGDVVFEGLDYTLTNSDPATPSLTVGRNTPDLATVALEIADVSSLFTSIGHNPDTNGTIQVSQGTFWNNSAALTVGREGNGRLLIEDDADVTTAELRIGDESGSDGVVEILGAASVDAKQEPGNLLTAGSTAIGLDGQALFELENAEIETGQTVIGAGPLGSGEAVVRESPDIGFWRYRGPFIVGDLGVGTLEIFSGGIVRDSEEEPQPFMIAEGANSVGTVRAHGFLATLATHAEFAVGRRGDGALTIEDEAFVSAQSMVIGPDGGDPPAEARGEVLVRGTGEALEDITLMIGDGRLTVGETGLGILTIENEGVVQAEAADLGAGLGGEGRLTIDRSTLEVEGFLSVGMVDIDTEEVLGRATIMLNGGEIQAGALFLEVESRVEGVGRIVSPSPILLGNVAPGVVVADEKGQTSESLGTLTLEGDAAFDGATLEIEIAGPDAFDTVEITGAAELTDTAVTLNFLDGYTPQTGDEFSFLTAINLTMQNVTFDVQGLDPAFEFELMPAGNTLMLMTTQGEDPVDEGTGEPPTSGCPAAATPAHSSSLTGDVLLVLFAALIVCCARQRRQYSASAS